MFEPWCLHVFTCLYHPVFSEFPETCPIRDIDGWREVSELELDVEIGSMAHDSASFDCTHVVVAACLCIYIYICVYIYIRIINIPTWFYTCIIHTHNCIWLYRHQKIKSHVLRNVGYGGVKLSRLVPLYVVMAHFFETNNIFTCAIRFRYTRYTVWGSHGVVTYLSLIDLDEEGKQTQESRRNTMGETTQVKAPRIFGASTIRRTGGSWRFLKQPWSSLGTWGWVETHKFAHNWFTLQ